MAGFGKEKYLFFLSEKVEKEKKGQNTGRTIVKDSGESHLLKCFVTITICFLQLLGAAEWAVYHRQVMKMGFLIMPHKPLS